MPVKKRMSNAGFLCRVKNDVHDGVRCFGRSSDASTTRQIADIMWTIVMVRSQSNMTEIVARACPTLIPIFQMLHVCYL